VEEGYPPDDPSPCLASIYLAAILTDQDRKDDGAHHLDAAEKAILGLRSRVQGTRVISLLADDPDEEIAQARLGMSLAQRTDNPTILALSSYGLGWALRHGHPDEALAALDQSVTLAGRGASTIVLPQALCHAAQAAASLGDADRARISAAVGPQVDSAVPTPSGPQPIAARPLHGTHGFASHSSPRHFAPPVVH
jgi:hypothetical protein